jgi:enolase-phosphatase E1
MNTPIRHILLDIEGTTCPVSFVSETLFPYAREHLQAFLQGHQDDPAVQELVRQVTQAWRADPDPEATALLQFAPANSTGSSPVVPYLHWLMQQDRKLTALKDLQGMIWEEGYRCGALQGPIYPDVPSALRRWRDAGLGLAVYSSGSINAQKLIYGHSNAGDLRRLFQHWFDTRSGSKLEPGSYTHIAAVLNCEPGAVLFISDSIAELQAASLANMTVLLCNRDGLANTQMDSTQLARIESFKDLDPMAGGAIR